MTISNYDNAKQRLDDAADFPDLVEDEVIEVLDTYFHQDGLSYTQVRLMSDGSVQSDTRVINWEIGEDGKLQNDFTIQDDIPF